MTNTPILGIPQVAPTQNDKTTTINDAVLAVENATQNQLTVSMASGNVTLTSAQFRGYMMFKCTSLTAAHDLIVPLQKRVFIVKNTSGSYAVTVKGSTGATVVVAVSSASLIECDGTDCTVLGSGGPGPTGPTGADGAITQVVAGVGLDGGTITSTGTISLPLIAAGDVMGNTGSGSAAAAGVTVSALLDKAFGTAEGDILARGASTWSAIAAGTSGKVLTTAGISAPPAWLDQLWNAGAVTGLGASMSLSGGTLDAASAEWQVGTVTAIAGSLSLTSGTLTAAKARDKGRLLAQWVLGTVAADGDFYFAYKMPYGGTVDSLDSLSATGTFTLAVKINGTNVTGLSAVAVSTAANTTATAAKTFVAGDTVTGTISSAASSPTDAVLSLNVTWS